MNIRTFEQTFALMEGAYAYILPLHIIFVVTWFAGLFYIVRLFIYHTEAEKKEEPEKGILQKQFKTMETRLWYGITWPSAVLVTATGLWMLIDGEHWRHSWMLLKLSFVFGLWLYHLMCGRIYKQLSKGEIKWTSTKLRIWNEVATVLLVAIVFIVSLRSTFDWIWGLVGLLIFSALLMIAIKVYRNIREKKSKEKQ